jgi:hypothetical protein
VRRFWCNDGVNLEHSAHNALEAQNCFIFLAAHVPAWRRVHSFASKRSRVNGTLFSIHIESACAYTYIGRFGLGVHGLELGLRLGSREAVVYDDTATPYDTVRLGGEL